MNDTTRVVLIAVGVVLLAAVLLPFLFMLGMMGGMAGGMMGGGGAWAMVGLVGLILVLGLALLAMGLGRHR